jgi:hypothetical protein
VDQHIRQEYQKLGISFSNGGDNTVMSCTAQAYKQGLQHVDTIKVQDGEIGLFAKQTVGYQFAQINAVEAANTPVQNSIAQIADSAQQQQLAQLAQQQNQTQRQGMGLSL